jgi:hypothetical protein
MSSSLIQAYPPIVQLLIDQDPESIIDVGPGWGTYGLACREHLQSLQSLHALERSEGRRPTQAAIYDWVYVGDTRDSTYNAKFWARWQLALFIDVIDYLTLDEGQRLFSKILNANTTILVATPTPAPGHTSPWSRDAFASYDIAADVSTSDVTICLLAP